MKELNRESINKIGKAGIRKGFFTKEQFEQALTTANQTPDTPFIKILTSLKIINETQMKELKEFEASYEKMLVNLPLVHGKSKAEESSSEQPDDTSGFLLQSQEEDSVLLSPISDEEPEDEETSQVVSFSKEVADSSGMVLIPEPETIMAEPSNSQGSQAPSDPMVLLPEPATLPSFNDLLKNLPSIPVEDKFNFENSEDEVFSKYAQGKNLLSRETIEVLLGVQSNLKKMSVTFSIAQLVKEFNYLEAQVIQNIQTSCGSQNTLLKDYELTKAEMQAISSKPQLYCDPQNVNEGKKLKEYFERLGIEKSLAESLLILGYYQKGAFQKAKNQTASPRLSSIRRASSLGNTSRASSSSRRPTPNRAAGSRRKRF